MNAIRGISVRLGGRLQTRVARPATLKQNITKTLIQIMVMWLLFFIAGPVIVYRLETAAGLSRYRYASPRLRFVAATIFLMGWTLGWWSAWHMVAHGKGTPLPADTARELVLTGPYLYVRNPMAAGSVAQGIAIGLFLGSPLVTAYAITGAVGWDILIRPWEEADLARRFGPPYEQYRDTVRCWLPHLQPYSGI